MTHNRSHEQPPFGVEAGDTGRWRTLIDLTPYVAKDIRLDGRDWLRIFYKLPEPGHPVYGHTRFLNPRKKSKNRM